MFSQQATGSIAKASDWEKEHINTLLGILENGTQTLEQSYAYIKNIRKISGLYRSSLDTSFSTAARKSLKLF